MNDNYWKYAYKDKWTDSSQKEDAIEKYIE